MADKTFLDSTGVAQLLSELKIKINNTFAKKTEITDFVKSSVLNNYKTSTAITQEIEQVKNDIIGKASDDTTANTIYALKKKLQEKADDKGNATQEWVTKQITAIAPVKILTLPDDFNDSVNFEINETSENYSTWANLFNIIINEESAGLYLTNGIYLLKILTIYKTEEKQIISFAFINYTNEEINFKLGILYKIATATTIYFKIEDFVSNDLFSRGLNTIAADVEELGEDLTNNYMKTILLAPNGGKYKIVVDNDGTLSTEAIEG